MMIVRLASAAVFAVGLAFAAPASGQTADAAAISAYFTNLADHPDELRVVTESIAGPMPDAVWDQYLPHVLPILRDPAYPAYVAGRIDDLVGPDVTEAALLVDFATMGDVWAFGLRRMPQVEQEAFLNVQIASLTWVRDNAPAACSIAAAPADPANNGILVATLTAEEAEALRAGTTLAMPFYEQNPDVAASYYALFARATLAEIHGIPEVRSVPGGAIPVDTLFAYSIAVFDYLGAMPNGAAAVAAMTAVTTDPNTRLEDVAPEVLCDVSIAAYAALADLPPAERSVMVLAIIVAIADPAAGATLMGAPP